MKYLSKQCKNAKQAVQYLNSVGLDGYVDADYLETCDFDFDGWVDGSETKGVSIQVTRKFEVSVVKYTKRDIEKLEAELE